MILDKIKDFFLRYTEEDRMNDVLIDNIICMFEKNKENITKEYKSSDIRYHGVDSNFYLDVKYDYGIASGYIKGVESIRVVSTQSANYVFTRIHESRSYKKLVNVLMEYERKVKFDEESTLIDNQTKLKQYILKKECK